MANIEDIKSEVRTKIKNDMLSFINNYEDNLAIKLVSDIKDYDASYCSETPIDKYNQEIIDYVNKIVDVELKILFKNT